jgi:photosystem II stability/assembly factor-like uncharacterized protein
MNYSSLFSAQSRQISIRISSLFAALAFLASGLFAQPVDLSKLKNMKARSIGPAGMSGRVTTIDAVRHNPEIIYAGTASGGLWKSENGGIKWEAIFDDQQVASIGAVAIAPSNSDVIWVGTGEGNPRNSQTSGYGVYKSLDGGHSWQYMGLGETHNIHRVIVHPENPEVVYVGAQGPAWGESEWRGVYKTTDGGENWEKILYANESTGIADLVMDPNNPNKLFAAMWQFRRWPWFFKSGGPGSGLHVTYDGGKNWKKLGPKDGLPPGELGRMGLAIAPSNSKRVYAFVEAKKNAIYRSDDGGMKWRQVSQKGDFGNRPFYYADIYVDSKNENRIYSIHSTVTYSIDGGVNWQTLIPYYGVHPDHQAWWIHPDDPNYIIEGNDGGMAISRDRGKTWRFVENLPLAQFYHINVDNDWPYHVYGGMQDNGSWKGPAYALRRGGIRNAYWTELYFGDGFDVVPDPENSRYGYAMSQGGNLGRYDAETGHSKFIQPVHPEGLELRFNWNAAIAQDPFDPATLYYGSQFVHKTTDKGSSWEIISPDLTTNDSSKQDQINSGGLTYDDTEAENHTTILAIAPSPHERGVLWVGTDDGNLHLSRDGGESWTQLHDRLPGAPSHAWIPQITPSPHQAGEVFVVVNNYRQNDWKPYLYHSTDYGQSWQRIVDESKVWGHCHAIVQDPVEPNLLFLGTEYGLYVSFDKGSTWQKWTHGFPTVSTVDLKIQEREHDLVIGTFGRAAFVLDDIRPLRELARDFGIMDARVHAFEAPTAVLAEYQQAAGTRFAADAMYAGENRRPGAMISYYVKEGKKDKMAMMAAMAKKDAAPEAPAESGKKKKKGKKAKAEEKASPESMEKGPQAKKRGMAADTLVVKIFDGEDLIRSLKLLPDSGLNRMYWDMRAKGVRMPRNSSGGGGGRFGGRSASDPPGAEVLPGDYTVRLLYRGDSSETTVKVIFDPRIEVTPAALQAKKEMKERIYDTMERAGKAVTAMQHAQKALEIIKKQMGEEADSTLKAQTKAMADSLKRMNLAVFGDPDVKGIRRNPNQLTSTIYGTFRYINSSYDAEDPTHELVMQHAEEALSAFVERVNAFFEKDWAAYRKAVEEAKLSPFKDFERIE